MRVDLFIISIFATDVVTNLKSTLKKKGHSPDTDLMSTLGVDKDKRQIISMATQKNAPNGKITYVRDAVLVIKPKGVSSFAKVDELEFISKNNLDFLIDKNMKERMDFANAIYASVTDNGIEAEFADLDNSYKTSLTKLMTWTKEEQKAYLDSSNIPHEYSKAAYDKDPKQFIEKYVPKAFSKFDDDYNLQSYKRLVLLDAISTNKVSLDVITLVDSHKDKLKDGAEFFVSILFETVPKYGEELVAQTKGFRMKADGSIEIIVVVSFFSTVKGKITIAAVLIGLLIVSIIFAGGDSKKDASKNTIANTSAPVEQPSK